MKRRNKKGAFQRCVESVAARGSAADPRAVCATAGVKKFGQAEMTRRAIAGKRRAARRRGNAPRVTQREVDSASASYHNMLMQYGENNMATQRAEFKYRDLQRAYADQKAKRAARGNAAERRYTLQYMNMGAWVDFEPYRTGPMERWRAEKRARAIARSGRPVRMVDQETGQVQEFEPQRRGRARGNPPKLFYRDVDKNGRERYYHTANIGRRMTLYPTEAAKLLIETGQATVVPKTRMYSKPNPADEKWSGSRVVRMWSNDGRKWEGRLYVNQGETATTQYKRGVTKGTLDRWAEKVLAGRYNPAESARAVSEEFHGRPVRAMIPVTEKRHYHKYLAELGELTLLVIHTPDGRRKVELSKFDGALLCTNEDKNQLFIKGGDQSVHLPDFGIRDPHEKEHLGELRKIAYYTDKEHLGDEGGVADYHHSFSKPYPHVDFRTRDTHLEISGGKYKITAEGIVG